MKIYSRITFITGCLHILIGLIFLLDFYLERQVNSILVGFFALFLGLGALCRSTRKDLDKKDKKNQVLRSKAREMALVVFQLILSLSVLATIIYYVKTKNQLIVPYIILAVSSMALIEMLESLFWTYYEKVN